MQHANILPRDNMHQHTRLQMSYLDKTGVKRKQIRMRQREIHRLSFPADEPIRPSSPPVAVDEERELRIVQEKFAVESFDGDGHVVLAGDKVQRGIGEIK